MTDPAIVQAPFGPEVDGRRLLGEAVGFARALRAARLSIDIGASVDFARALTLVEIGDREQVHGAGAAIFVRRRDDRETYDKVFDRWWKRRGSRVGADFQAPPLRRPEDDADQPDDDAAGATQPEPGTEAHSARPGGTWHAASPPRARTPADDEAPIEGVVVAPDAYSQGEVLRHREFDRMTPGGAARGGAPGGRAHPAPGASPDPSLRAALATVAAWRHGRCSGATSGPAASSCRGSGGGRSGSRARSWSCATSRARWSATRGCCCGSSRRCRRRRRSGRSRSCSGRG